MAKCVEPNKERSDKEKETMIFAAMFRLIIFLAEQNFSLLGEHFSHLSKNILYTRPVQRTHKKK